MGIVCAHGYRVLKDAIVMSYKCSEKFYAKYNDGIMWNDPDLAVDWPLDKVGGQEKLFYQTRTENCRLISSLWINMEGFKIEI